MSQPIDTQAVFGQNRFKNRVILYASHLSNLSSAPVNTTEFNMTNKARCEQEKRYCRLAVRHLIRDAQRRTGLTRQGIDDRLHLANHGTVGDGCGTRLSRYITGSRTPKVEDLDRLVRTFLKADLVSTDIGRSHASMIALASVEALLDNEGNSVSIAKIESDRARFLSWTRQKCSAKRAELRALNTRVLALRKAAKRLLELLDGVDGRGHDGWECKPTLPMTINICHYSPGGALLGFERDAIRWLLNAATDTAQNIELKVGYHHGAHMSSMRAGWYNPRPPAVPDEVIHQDLIDLELGNDEGP